MTLPKLTFIERTDRHGNTTIAPFIGDYNVWDLYPDEWTPNVQAAIKHAFELGRASMAQEIEKVCWANTSYAPSEPWGEVAK